MKRAISLAAPVLALVTIVAHAEIYRWVDKDGITVYSQIPPSTGQARLVRPPPPPATPTDRARKQFQAMEDKVRKAQAERDRRAELEKEAAKKREQDAKRCAQAKRNKQNIPIQSNGLVLDRQGRSERLTEERWKQLHAEADEGIRKYCR